MEAISNGVIDPYLLSPLGKLDGTSFKITAVCSGLSCAEAADAAILLEKEGYVILMRIASSTEIIMQFLEPIEIKILTDFINKYRSALNDHWLGAIDSAELVQRLAGSEISH